MTGDDLHITQIGAGTVRHEPGGSTHLDLPPVSAEAYHDAQITSYAERRAIALEPPVSLRLKAQAGGELRGTAGFGFWNHPFAPNERGFRLPKAAWFFHASPPNHMPLARDVPGHGWKCATIDATRPGFLALLPTAPVGLLLMQVRPLYRLMWPLGQAALGISERALDPALLQEQHSYRLDWERGGVTFYVDGVAVHRTAFSPGGPLGFIAWVDNQYAVVTPQGRLRFGLVDAPAAQSLVLSDLRLERA